MTRFLAPDWPAPAHIKAFSTTRNGGHSRPPFDSLNLGDHVGDCPETVIANRESLPLQTQACWLNQVHGNDVIEFSHNYKEPPKADGCFSVEKHQICAVMTADCLPVLLTDTTGTFIAAIHCGWRGLAQGILEKFVATRSDPENILAWMGPAIGPGAFEVGEDVVAAFPGEQDAFIREKGSKPFANIFKLARKKLMAAGVMQIYSTEHCTVSSPSEFFSFRRDGVTGRMATCIWME